MRRRAGRQKELEVLSEYLEAHLADAIRDSLKALFSEPALPDNPYHYLAAALAAYVDQSSLWACTDAALVAALDSNGGLELADASSRLCRLSSCSGVLGLPHVLRCVSKEGAKVVADVLTNSLPDSFFPGPAPYGCERPGYSIQVLSSVQGSTVMWHPQWLEFPELAVRCDVVMRGPRLDEALGLLAELLAADLQDLEAVPVHFVEGIRLLEPLGAKQSAPAGDAPAASAAGKAATAGSAPAAAAGLSYGLQAGPAAAGGLWTLAAMQAHPDEFKRVLAREVLSGKQVVLAGVVMLEAPVDAAHLQDYAARFECCSKTYCFHFWETPERTAQPAALGPLAADASSAASLRPQVSHFGCQPFEALFEGYFLHPASVKAYMALHQEAPESGATPQPYSREVLALHARQLSSLIEADMVRGATLEGCRRLLLLVLLHDGRLTQRGPLAPSSLLTLEELLLLRPPECQQDMLLSTAVNLVRIINSGAADIQAVVRELSALMLVVQQWPQRREACVAHARSAATDLCAAQRGAPPEAAAQDQQQHATQLLAWLGDHANMEARVVQQVASLAPRVAAATGSGVFAGISIVLAGLLEQLPDGVPASAAGCVAALQAAQWPMEALQQLLAAAALSLADALLDRCRDVMWALQRFGIRLVDSVMARAALALDGVDLAPEWVLDVEAVTEAQVRAGAVADRVATEGVMLQYAVDTKLDECLVAMYTAVTTPPLPANPYPRLLHTLRAYAVRLDLLQEDQAEAAARLLNQLALLSGPADFMYAATPPAGPAGGWRRRGLTRAAAAGASTALEDDDESSSTVWGSYAAVTLCDCRSLHALTGSLGPLLAQRSWQQGAYCADVVPALTGDAFLSGALALHTTRELETGSTQGSRQLGGQGSSAVGAPYEHERWGCVELEEHHQVEGPCLDAAAGLWARGLVAHVLQLHHKSQHIVHRLAVAGGDTFQLQALLQPAAQEACATALAAAARHAAAARPATYADCCLAVVHLLAVVKEGLYVKVLARQHLHHRTQRLAHNTTSTVAQAAHRRARPAPRSVLPSGPGSLAAAGAAHAHAGAQVAADGHRAASTSSSSSRQHLDAQEADAEAAEPHWDMGVYQRVFLTQGAAQAWAEWNGSRGDPAQPFHYEHLQQHVQQQVQQLERQGCLLDAQKLLLLAASAVQDSERVCALSRAMQSPAQELRCLQDMNASLQLLLAHDLPPEQRAKLDQERVRRLFLLYCARLRRAMTSPKCCYFSGFAAAAPLLIARLRAHVLTVGALRLDGHTARLMAQLNLWSRACELSVAASTHECVGAGWSGSS